MKMSSASSCLTKFAVRYSQTIPCNAVVWSISFVLSILGVKIAFKHCIAAFIYVPESLSVRNHALDSIHYFRSPTTAFALTVAIVMIRNDGAVYVAMKLPLYMLFGNVMINVYYNVGTIALHFLNAKSSEVFFTHAGCNTEDRNCSTQVNASDEEHASNGAFVAPNRRITTQSLRDNNQNELRNFVERAFENDMDGDDESSNLTASTVVGSDVLSNVTERHLVQDVD